MNEMKQSFIISLLIHVSVVAVVIIASATVGNASKAKMNLGPTVSVNTMSELPKGMQDIVEMPSLQAPVLASVENTYIPEPDKLKSITQKEKINKPKPKPKKKPEKKPETKPKDTKPKDAKPPDDQLAAVDNTDKPSGSSMEMSMGGSESGAESVYNGPLGEYYLSYDFNYIKSLISRNWDNPVRSNSLIACKVYFQVTKNGAIQGVIVSESSGNNLFDRYAELAVKSVKKLPSLPQSFPDNEVLEVTLIFAQRP